MASSPDTHESTRDDLLPEYNFRELREVVRGEYADRIMSSSLESMDIGQVVADIEDHLH